MVKTEEHICYRVRKWADRVCQKYNFSYDLCGMCFICSGIIHTVFKSHGINSEIVFGFLQNEWSGHVITSANNKIYDVTGTQFRVFKGKPVVILSEPEYYAQLPMKDFRKFEDLEDAIEVANDEHWPMEQIPDRVLVDEALTFCRI